MNQHAHQMLRANLYLFVWLFLVIFFVESMFFAYWMDWKDERLVVLLAGAIGASIQAIAMLTNTVTKGGNRLSDIGGGGGDVDSTTTTTLTTETQATERTVLPEKPKEDPKDENKP